jgi:hypothetical protein
MLPKKYILYSLIGLSVLVGIGIAVQLRTPSSHGEDVPAVQNNASANHAQKVDDAREYNRQSCIKSIAEGGKRSQEYCTCKMNLELNVEKLKNEHMRSVFGDVFYNKLMDARRTDPSQEEMREWFLEEEKFQPSVDAYEKPENEKCLALYIPDEEGGINQIYTELYNNCMNPGDLGFGAFIQPATGVQGARTQKYCQCISAQMAKAQYIQLVPSGSAYQKTLELKYLRHIEDGVKNPCTN